jgi:tetratricopeptide (TPR) repeat protein
MESSKVASASKYCAGKMRSIRPRTHSRKRPEKLERRRDLSIALLNVGDALAAEQKWEEARPAYEQCRVVREELAPKDSHNLLWQRDLAYVLERIGTTFAKQKQFAAALAQYRRALTIRERVRAAEAGNVTYARELALSHSLIAETLYGSGAKDEAKASYLAALGVVERYATRRRSRTMRSCRWTS